MMGFFRKIFGGHEDATPIMRVQRIMQKFIEASFIGLESSAITSPSQGLTMLLYMKADVAM